MANRGRRILTLFRDPIKTQSNCVRQATGPSQLSLSTNYHHLFMSSQGRGSRGRGGPSRGGYGQGGPPRGGYGQGGGGGGGRGGGGSGGDRGGYGQGGGGGRGGGGGGDRGRGRGGAFGSSDGRGRGGPMGRGGPPRGGPGGRGRGDFGIWQENVRAVYPPQLKAEADKVVERFKAAGDDSPSFPLRTFLQSHANAHLYHFVSKVLDGGHLANLV